MGVEEEKPLLIVVRYEGETAGGGDNNLDFFQKINAGSHMNKFAIPSIWRGFPYAPCIKISVL